MATTYPPAAPQVEGDSVTIHRFLQNPTQVARRLATLAQQRYIADAILKGRFNVEGGAITYESGEPLFTGDDPRAVAPGGEYPQTSIGEGAASVAKTTKWGQDVPVTDEAIKRLKRNPVDRAFNKLINQNVRYVDSIALSAVSSRVTASQAAAAVWATAGAEQILTDVMTAKAQVTSITDGAFAPDTVVVDDLSYAYALAKFIAAGYLPREAGDNNPVVTGEFPRVNGMLWLPTPHGFAATAMVLDSEQLGGMADEDLGSPGYVRAPNGNGVEAKSIRDDDNDRYKLRARRVTVPVVLEPGAARKITGISA
jgi:hypothetical protein